MRTITLTHAVLNQQFELVAPQLFGMYYSEVAKATVLLSCGTTTVPVKESINDIKELLKNCGVESGIHATINQQ
jgi:hypothetical protein